MNIAIGIVGVVGWMITLVSALYGAYQLGYKCGISGKAICKELSDTARAIARRRRK